jgi:hypothetical protein
MEIEEDIKGATVIETINNNRMSQRQHNRNFTLGKEAKSATGFQTNNFMNDKNPLTPVKSRG